MDKEKLTILIPTLGRANRIEGIIKNIEDSVKCKYDIIFIVEDYDKPTIDECHRLKQTFLTNRSGTYVSAINLAFKVAKYPFIFLGSDDIELTLGCLEKMLEVFKDEKIGVVGHFDNWDIGKTGHHGSHLLIRKEYIQKYSGVEDEKDVIYSSQYKHYYPDIETEQTAMKRKAFAMCDVEIKHHHWVNGEAVMDKTYTDNKQDLHHDQEVFDQRRRRFEQWFFDDLYHGRSVQVNQKKLSIVIGSYNAPDALKETLESLMWATYHPFELIIVDDVSTNERTKEIIREFQHPNVKKFFLKEHLYTTGVWNFGVDRATGDVIVVANNDITFSKWWDVYLINAFNDEDVYLANPYSTDDGEMKPYGRADRAGGIEIRGICYAISKESRAKLFPLPENLVMWFSDFWIAWKVVDKLKKKSVWVERSVVHNLGSKSSIDYQRETGLLWWIIRGDALQFQVMTGIDTTHWLSVAEAKLPYANR